MAFAEKDAVRLSGLVRFGGFLLRVFGAFVTFRLAGLIRVNLAQKFAWLALCLDRVVLGLSESYSAWLT